MRRANYSYIVFSLNLFLETDSTPQTAILQPLGDMKE